MTDRLLPGTHIVLWLHSGDNRLPVSTRSLIDGRWQNGGTFLLIIPKNAAGIVAHKLLIRVTTSATPGARPDRHSQVTYHLTTGNKLISLGTKRSIARLYPT